MRSLRIKIPNYYSDDEENRMSGKDDKSIKFVPIVLSTTKSVELNAGGSYIGDDII